jgi:methionine--tRNA ligase beta chain
MSDKVSFAEFKKLGLRIGKVLTVEDIEGLDKIYKLTVDVGEEKPRTILAGIKEFLKPQDLEGKNIVVVANLDPKEVRGVLSDGMLLAAEVDGKPILITPESEVEPGTPVH